MKKFSLFPRWFIVPVILVVMVAIIITGSTWSYFEDIETTNSNSMGAWVSTNWTKSVKSDYDSGVLQYTETSANGSVQLARALFVLRGGGRTTTWSYSPAGNNWTVEPVTPATISSGGGLAYDGARYIYALRGSSTGFYRYDVLGDNWITRANTPANINDGATCVYANGYVFAFRGGSTTFYRYSIAANTWATMNATPNSIGDDGALAWDNGNYIYALRGGGNTNFYRYSISGMNWVSLSATPGTMNEGDTLVCAFNGYVYALRGGNTNTFYRYSIAGQSWSTLTAAPGAIGGDTQIVYDRGDYLYVPRSGGTTAFYRYSISGGSWATMTPAPASIAEGGGMAGPISTGQIASQVLNSGINGSRWDGLFWSENLPAGTDISFEVRASDTSFTMTATNATLPWVSVGATSPVLSGMPSGRYKQWRATLSTTDAIQTPSLNSVRVYYYGPG